MRYIVEWFIFDALQSTEEYIGEDIPHEARFRSYVDALAFSCDKIKNDENVHALFLSELDDDGNIQDDSEPILSYCPHS